MPVGDTLFGVDDKGISHIIDIATKSYNCEARSTNSILRKYVLACIMHNGLDIFDFVDNYYKKETYLKAYVGMIHPLLDKSLCPHVQANNINPAPSKKALGKSKLNRRIGFNEVPVYRRRYALKCSVCGKFRHNKRACLINLTNTTKMKRRY